MDIRFSINKEVEHVQVFPDKSKSRTLGMELRFEIKLEGQEGYQVFNRFLISGKDDRENARLLGIGLQQLGHEIQLQAELGKTAKIVHNSKGYPITKYYF